MTRCSRRQVLRNAGDADVACGPRPAGHLTAPLQRIPGSPGNPAWRWTSSHAALAHNYLSGHGEPSAAAISITRQLNDALALVGTTAFDHLAVAGTRIGSFAEKGIMP